MALSSLLQFRSWGLGGLASPFSGESLYAWVAAHGGRDDLPDEEDKGENTIRWSAGAKDGVLSHHEFDPESSETSWTRAQIISALERLVKRSTEKNLSAFCAQVCSLKLFSEVEELEQLIRGKLLKRFPRHLSGVGVYLVLNADKRENVKLGMLLLKLAGDESSRSILELLATHDEFTLYAAQALVAIVSDPELTLWNLAKNVHGWGKSSGG